MVDKYYLTDNIPEIFKIADKQMAKKYPKPKKAEYKPYVMPRSIRVKMPDIHSNPNIEGPLYCTQEWYDKQIAKREKKYRKAKQEANEEVVLLLARKEHLNDKLGKLDFAKKKDRKKIAKINIEMENINYDIQMWRDQYDVDVKALDRGTRLSRFIGKTKRLFSKVKKKIKKFYRNNTETINGIIMIAVPSMISMMVKAITKG